MMFAALLCPMRPPAIIVILSRPILYELRNRGHPLQTLLLAARSEKAIRTSPAYIFEAAKEIHGHVKSSVEGHIEGPRQFDQLAGLIDIHITLRFEDAQDNTIGP